MKVLLYFKLENEIKKKILGITESLTPEIFCESHSTIESLKRRFMSGLYDLSVFVLVPANQEDLSALVTIRDLFMDIRTILILPDRKKKTVAMGFELFPRFVSYQDSNFKDVEAVLKKMLGHIDGKNF